MKGALKILLIERDLEPFKGQWALLLEESLKDAASLEVENIPSLAFDHQSILNTDIK